MTNLATDVTSENYRERAVAFAERNKSHFLATIEARSERDKIFAASPRQFGAWLAYFSRLRKPGMVKLMKAKGYATVPAEWPHELDAVATIQGDHAAADRFIAGRQRREARP